MDFMCVFIFFVGTYFAASMVLVSLSCFLTIVILNVFYRGQNGRRVPRWAKIYIIGYLGRLVCSRANKIKDMDGETPPKVSNKQTYPFKGSTCPIYSLLL